MCLPRARLVVFEVVVRFMQHLLATAGFTRRLQDFLGQEIIVPAKTVGLSDLEQFLPGKVVDYNMEDNSLWCTVSGDKRW